MLSNIKAYQSETASHCCPSQNSPSCCTPGRLFTNGFFLILTSNCLFPLIQNALAFRTGWFGGPSKRNFMGLVGFECPLRGKKKLLLERKNLDSVLKPIST